MLPNTAQNRPAPVRRLHTPSSDASSASPTVRYRALFLVYWKLLNISTPKASSTPPYKSRPRLVPRRSIHSVPSMPKAATLAATCRK